MATKSIGFCVSVTTKSRRSNYIEGMLTKEKALIMATKLAKDGNKIEIDREYIKTDRYGEEEAHSKPFGVLKRVKRKTGYAYVIQTYDAYGWDSYVYDVDPKTGKMKNRR